MKKIAIITLFILTIISVVGCGASKTDSKATAADPKTAIQNTLKNTIAMKINDKPQLEKVIVTDSKDNSGKLVVEVHMLASEGFDTKGAMESTILRIKDASKALFSNYKNIDQADYHIDADLTDQYGNTKTAPWFNATLRGDDGYKINYDNLVANGFGKFLTPDFDTNDAATSFQQILSE